MEHVVWHTIFIYVYILFFIFYVIVSVLKELKTKEIIL